MWQINIQLCQKKKKNKKKKLQNIKQHSWIQTRVEAGSNTSTVTLRVVRGDEMGLKKAAP
jgi:hypothetical protein